MSDYSPTPSPTDSPADLPKQGGSRAVTLILWALVVLVVAFVVMSRLAKPRPSLAVYFHAPAFTLTDEEGQSFSASDLKGKAFICDFVFTTCGSICPTMTRTMATLQKKLPPDVHFVSFSVDPEHDTPAVLKVYAQDNGADLSRWHFLTGKPSEIAEIERQMKILVATTEPAELSPGVAASGHSFSPAVPLATTTAPIAPAIVHSDQFFLIDGDGNVRALAHVADADEVEALARDADWLSTTWRARGQ